MKKTLFLFVLMGVLPLIAQDQMPQLPQGIKQQPFTEKLQEFKKVAQWLQKSRECLSGIGCSKNQSYFANYSLGVAVGFIQQSALIALAQKNRTLADLLAETALLPQELGYRYFVLQPVNLFRCITFQGCDDQTKRYLFYRLGIYWGVFGRVVYHIAANTIHEQYEEAGIRIKDKHIKQVLNLNPKKDRFEWYEVFGFTSNPDKNSAQKQFRKLSLQYHPDRMLGKSEDEKTFAGEVMKVLSQAKNQGGL